MLSAYRDAHGPPDPATFIELRRVQKTHRLGTLQVAALSDVSVAFRHGSFSAIVGPSGCGKSTLLGLLGGLDRPDSGAVLVNGVDLGTGDADALGTYRRNAVGFVFQSFNLLRSLNAVENVEVTLRFSGLSAHERRTRAMESLERVGVAPVARQLPQQMSGGQQQRVAIARAIARRPSLILADEPTGNLDREAGQRVFDCLRQLQRDLGVTCILVTHDKKLAASADHVVRLRNGRLVRA